MFLLPPRFAIAQLVKKEGRLRQTTAGSEVKAALTT
jgi:hypothetical protein